MSKTTKGMLAGFCGNFIFGFSFLFTTKALAVTTPSVLLAWRFLIAFALMNILLLIGKVKIHLHGKSVLWLTLMGLCQPVLYFYFENYGLLYSNTTFASVMLALVPSILLLVGAVFMHEKPTVLQTVCSCLSVAGVVAIALHQTAKGIITLPGVILLIGAVTTAVGFNIISRHYAQTVSAFERTYIMFAVGTVAFLTVAVLENRQVPFQLVAPFTHMPFVISLGYLGILSSLVAYLLINYANTWLPLSRAGIFTNVITVVSVFAGIVILREPVDLYTILIALCILLGICGVQFFSAKNTEPKIDK